MPTFTSCLAHSPESVRALGMIWGVTVSAVRKSVVSNSLLKSIAKIGYLIAVVRLL